jgi:hypothetical protein
MFKNSKTIILGDKKNLPGELVTLKSLAKKQGISFEQFTQLPDMSYFEKESAILLFSGEFFKKNEQALLNIREFAFFILCEAHEKIETFDLECFDLVINLNQELSHYIPTLKTFTKLSKKLTNEKVGRLYERTSAKLERIKKIHEKVVPVRVEKTKNVSVLSKYAAGTSRGGDFFDISSNENNITLLMSTTKSYITSTVVTSHFEKIQNSLPSRPIYEDSLENLINECRDLELISREEPDLLELFLINIDLRKLSYFGFQFGRFQCFSTNAQNDYHINEAPLNENFVEECFIEGKLLPGEKLAILSPGIYKNLDRSLDQFKEIEKTSSKDLLNNIFFNLKKENDFNDFLKFDSTVAIIEVSSNVLVQV